MRRLSTLVALAVLGVTLLVSAASGQDWLMRSQTPGYDIYTERHGITNASLAVGVADSCDAFDNHRYGLGILVLKVVPPDTVAACRFAVQIRYHYLGATDTTAVAPIYPIHSYTAATGTDSTGHLAAGSAHTPWPSEYEVVVTSATTSAGNYAFPWSIALALPPRFGDVRPAWLSYRIRNLAGGPCKVDAYYTAGAP